MCIDKVQYFVRATALLQLTAKRDSFVIIRVYRRHVVSAIIHVHAVRPKPAKITCVCAGSILSNDARDIWLES